MISPALGEAHDRILALPPSGKTPIGFHGATSIGTTVIAPEGFLEHAVSEMVYAGTAMLRRSFFQYGVLMPASPFGHVDQAIGKNVAA